MSARRILSVLAVVGLLSVLPLTVASASGTATEPDERQSLIAQLLGILSGPRPAPPAAPAPPPPPPAPVDDFEAVRALGSSVTFFDAAGGAPQGNLANPTQEGYPLVLSVLENRGEWLLVRIPRRPNSSTAWVRATEVASYRVPNRVQIDVSDRQLTVMRGRSDEVLLREPVAVGAAETPTPLADSYVDIAVALQDTSGPYGTRQLSVGAFSEVYRSFAGGNGQIAIHGTNNPGLIGSAVSNGCIRMHNDGVDALARLAPVGTPVRIVA